MSRLYAVIDNKTFIDSNERIQKAFEPSKRLHTCNVPTCAKNIIVRRHPKCLNFWRGIYKNFPHFTVKFLQRQCRLPHLKLYTFTPLMFMRDGFIAQIQDKIGYSSHRNNHTQQRNQPRQTARHVTKGHCSSHRTRKNQYFPQSAVKPDMPFVQTDVIRQIKLGFVFRACFRRGRAHEFLTSFLVAMVAAGGQGEVASGRAKARSFSQDHFHQKSAFQSWLAPWGVMVVGTSIIRPQGVGLYSQECFIPDVPPHPVHETGAVQA